MSKFDTILAEYLYQNETPSETVGSSSEGVGWAGIFSEYGVIIREDTDGFVTTTVCTVDDVALTWESIQNELEINNPEEGDYVIDQKGGYRVIQLGFTFESYSEALAAIAEDMAEQKFWPNVWLLGERGDFTNVSGDLPNLSQ